MLESTDASFFAPHRLVRLIRKHRELDADSEDRLLVCFNEVRQNIVDHAESAIGGITTARFLSSRNEVRAAVVDRGKGIGTTLRRVEPGLNDEQSLRAVVKGSHTSRSRMGNQGLGIRYLSDIVKMYSGTLLILSGAATASLTAAGQVVRSTANPFPGTVVFFTLRLN